MPTVKKTSAKQNLKVKKTIKKIAVKTAVKKPALKSAVAKKPVAKVAGLRLDVYDIKGKIVAKADLPKEIFEAKINNELMAQAVRVYLANQRQGTVSTKTRGEVQGSSKKIYRQKGTGRARHGSIRAPIFVKGGLVFGPKPRDYSLKLSKKMKKLALFSALSTKLKENEIKVLGGLEKIEPKTKFAEGIFKNLELGKKGRKVLLVTPLKDKEMENVYKATRNLEGVSIIPSNLLNTYEILDSRQILLMKASIDAIKNTFLKEEKE